jgi:acetoin utilization deacetylase AcuC-like enzyme
VGYCHSKPVIVGGQITTAPFDGHFDDELNPGNSFSEQAFIYLAQGIKSYMDKSQAKLVAAFEGGYSLEGLSNSIVHMMNVIGNWQVNPEVIGFVDQPSDLRNDQALTELRRNIEELEEKMKKIREFNPSYNL